VVIVDEVKGNAAEGVAASGSGLVRVVVLVACAAWKTEGGTVVEDGVMMSWRLRAVPSDDGVVATERVIKAGGRERMSCRSR
jgi:hypothetical protein